MAANATEEIGTLLQSLSALKAPGITKSKIDAITAKCVENVQAESDIVQKIVAQVKNSVPTHKLGVIYVVDSVTRQWLDKAKSSGQAVSKNAAPGTYASGVQKVTDVLPGLMSDLIQNAPDAQKDKISKLLDIWDRGQTFPHNMIASFKKQVEDSKSYTPPGSPPKATHMTAAPTAPTVPANPASAAPQAPALADTGALLAALAKMGQNGQTNTAPPAPQAMAAPVALPVPFAPNVAPPPPPAFVPPPPVGQAVPPPPSNNAVLQQVLQAMQAGLLPPDQAMALLAAVAQAQQQGAAPFMQPPQQPQQQLPQQHLQQPPQPAVANPIGVPYNAPHPACNDQSNGRFRDRSRSPEYTHHGRSDDRRTPPNRRDSPTYGVYDPNARPEGNHQDRNDRGGARGRGKQRGRGRDDYRQRSPPRRQPSPPQNGQRKYFLEWDHSLPRDSIKVLSRTLFVGGAGGTEAEIRSIFSRFGQVQTCIVNLDKRHAFVKMVNRADAVAAKEGMDKINDPALLAKARQTRWGVGFGPRDCSDYNVGVSVIPISRLTDADRKWVVTAEYGGTGGVPLQGGMVIEEPDIEIGAGVSSKAISRRVPPDASRRGGHHNHRGGFDNGPRNFNKPRGPPSSGQNARHISPRPEQSVAVPPVIPGFGFQLPGF
ncbi:hypothetical protein M011DRAFT_470323 [Sporormia fimetaria CBS 119925]|uniref:RNA binding protein Nrd1 n=1 Tax=Sporormia fimetaria CBS 119925 TaxID=1340428 RepID=A0A6A6V437_9PLEO|nr:hypothetical protein M011DRAFT_470323 [Sporormia fimetaria CBS 119925]